MKYFDSAKNAAMWEKEMVGLRAERARRESEGFKPVQKAAEERTAAGKAVEKTAAGRGAKQDARANDPRHRAITLAELEEIEVQMTGVRRVKRPTRQRARSLEMQSGEKKASVPARKMGG